VPTRQDQLHSYQFLIQRVVAALVMRETDPPQSPFRRAAGATIAGVMVAVLALAAVAVYGVLSPGGGTGWRDGGAVIVERESGARFVYREGKLHPVVNYASALLILGSAGPKTVYVARNSIAGVPRGVPLGIPGAPDSLPEQGKLLGAPWTLCSRGTESVLFVGPHQLGGRQLGENALLARHPDGTIHLIWHHRRHLVRDPAVTLAALSWGSEPLAPLAAAALNVLPAGADLARIPIPERGRRSVRVPDARNGEVFLVESQGGGRQYAVALRDGLATITQVQADLLIGDPLTASLVGQTSPRRLGQGEYAVLPKLGPLQPANDLSVPATTPAPARLGGAVCGVVRDPSGVAEVLIDAVVPEIGAAARTGSRTGAGGVLADLVLVPPGRGAVVEALASPGAPSGTLSVVTDLGRRHEVTGADVLSMLGFANARPVRLPAGVVALLPAGEALDPAAALAPVTG
jgi:type VII secretion protein EccB